MTPVGQSSTAQDRSWAEPNCLGTAVGLSSVFWRLPGGVESRKTVFWRVSPWRQPRRNRTAAGGAGPQELLRIHSIYSVSGLWTQRSQFLRAQDTVGTVVQCTVTIYTPRGTGPRRMTESALRTARDRVVIPKILPRKI